MTRAQIDRICQLAAEHPGEYRMILALAVNNQEWPDAVRTARLKLLAKYDPHLAGERRDI